MTAPARLATLARTSKDAVSPVEREMDGLGADLPPLTRFVLPGGTTLAAVLHHARTVCRRAERRVTALAAREDVSPRLVHWLNPGAGLLFVMARWAKFRARGADRTWTGGGGI